MIDNNKKELSAATVILIINQIADGKNLLTLFECGYVCRPILQ